MSESIANLMRQLIGCHWREEAATYQGRTGFYREGLMSAHVRQMGKASFDLEYFDDYEVGEGFRDRASGEFLTFTLTAREIA